MDDQRVAWCNDRELAQSESGRFHYLPGATAIGGPRHRHVVAKTVDDVGVFGSGRDQPESRHSEHDVERVAAVAVPSLTTSVSVAPRSTANAGLVADDGGLSFEGPDGVQAPCATNVEPSQTERKIERRIRVMACAREWMEP